MTKTVIGSESTVNEVGCNQQMQVANLIEQSKVVVGYDTIPRLLPNEVLIKVEAVGICGSDIHYYKHGHIGKRQVKYPHIQGHECSGVIVQVGEKVTKFSIGDRVTVEPGIPCKTCENCRSGKYNLCEKVIFLSTPPHKGTLRQFINHPEDFVFSIPDSLSFEEATLAEPLSVAIHALNRANIQPGKKVLITGMGPVGLMTVCAANYFNADEITVTDMLLNKLEVAKKLGATETVQVPSEVIKDNYYDLVIETSGSKHAIQSGILSLKKGGKFVSIGFPPTSETPLDLTLMLQKEVDLLTVYRYVNTFPLSIKVLTQMKDVLGEVITSTYPLGEISKAMKTASDLSSGSIKVIVYPNADE
ncbi:NAD(P)-dependent alcohol dehydrogenase [Lysinibacillus telephonicus]|uniref:NAD(P)-dependent alcohol dehydrogenase n=1 Tax=Lysinibacillus telephonicus TaxID=1714840 RepID=A0A3S0JYM1_9BACI|nr:NAD(P)-dependent alcohol dehydrogenase [Lysinibacillus telephonicus]RTQ95097.1 NAD(P)-dependent alcohol dehydrogenase [Lysinibacillus telephonicus]